MRKLRSWWQPGAGGAERTPTPARRPPRRVSRTAVKSELRLLPRLPCQPLAEGARRVHPRDRREARVLAGRHPRLHLLRRRRHPRGAAGVLPAPERAHPRPGRAAGAGHADDDLQRLHAQPAPGQQQAERRPRAAGAGQPQPARGRCGRLLGRRRGAPPALGDRRGRGLREAQADRREAAHGRQDRALLRLPDPAPVQAAGVRGSRPAAVAGADHRGLRRRAGRLPLARSSAAASRSCWPARRWRWAS